MVNDPSSTSKSEEVTNPNPQEDADVETNPPVTIDTDDGKGSDEEIVPLETGDKVTTSSSAETEDDAVFLDCRSTSTDDSVLLVGSDGGNDSETDSEKKTESGALAKNESSSKDIDVSNDEPSPIDGDGEEDKADDNDESKLIVVTPVKASNSDQSLRLRAESSESSIPKKDNVALEPKESKSIDSETIGGKASRIQEETADENDGMNAEDKNDDETSTTYVDDLPLFHYSRIVGAGLPKGIQANAKEQTAPVQRSTCSEFAVVRVDREMLVSSTSRAPASPTRSGVDSSAVSQTGSMISDNLSQRSTSSAAEMREQALLLTSDLWSQPHSIVATGYGGKQGGMITFTKLARSSNQGGDSGSSSPVVVFATDSTELGTGGVTQATGHGTGSRHKYSNFSTVLQVWEESRRVSSVVDMSFDASGCILGAVDEGGHCAIWEFKYTTSLQSTSLLFDSLVSSQRKGTTHSGNSSVPSSAPSQTRPQDSSDPQARAAQGTGMFSNFMSVLTGIPPPDENVGGRRSMNNSTHGGPTTPNNNIASVSTAASSSQPPARPAALVPALTAEILNISRINYPAKWGPPTCIAIDPSYKLKRDKSVVVGFANGQLYLTKKGTFFQRRNDTILYQAANRGDSSYLGIETVVWRGPLVAFADATGIKLIDSVHLTRIAHIARPAGASPFLYPSIRDISPSLTFETAQHLLVGWGDCLMQIHVEEQEEDASSTAPTTAQSGGSSETEKKIKRSAACTMAWELDCVACDVVPLDSNHVVVLGMVSLTDGEYGIEKKEGDDGATPTHDLEMQIVSRKDGTISYSDSLPLLEQFPESEITPNSTKPSLSVRNFRLLSSFSLPRMEEIEETRALQALKGSNEMGLVGIDVSFDINQPLFAGTDAFLKKGIQFKDPHTEWNINSIVYDEDDEFDYISNGENSSIDSDDYECILRPIETVKPLSSKDTNNASHESYPPTMVVCTESEAILSITSTVDDAIECSLENHKYAQALCRGIRHKRELRRFSLDDLINYYLEAVLRISPSNSSPVTTKPELSLSLRRMQLAVKAMPVLLGDRIELWERWTTELENIPGALFLLRKYIPVRDPSLPSQIYVRILENMMREAEHLSQTSRKENPSSTEIYAQASKQFLESLIAWGPTKVLKEYISYYKYNKEKRGIENDLDALRSTQISLQRRYLQTAAGYLIFPVRDIEEELPVSAPRYEVLNADTEDSLFDVSKAVALIAPRVPIVSSPDDFDEGELPESASYALAPNNHTCLEAMARLRMMQGEFYLALKCFLAIGACHATDPLESFEESAIRIVNGTNTTIESSPSPIGNYSYEFVMELIQRHELNQFLFENDFLLPTDSKIFMPIFALIRLVGLEPVGNFLIEHCVAAGFTYSTTLSEMNFFSFSNDDDSVNESKGIPRRGSLPIDKVAEQLENSPAILHWYLHLVFTKRPDFYVKVPTNSNPSKAVTNLHRKHFQLYIDFAGEARDSSRVLAGLEAYKVGSKTTPLLTFLKAALPLGGIMPKEARSILEIERSKDATSNGGDKTDSEISSSPIFALELAYIIEKYSDETETEALGILNLYLKGAKSLPLAVAYAERQKKFTSALWDHLISHCLREAADGTIYGELLEAAALTGADLARLVKRIPPGMNVEGLRPRLVAAVADYRMKLEIYEAAIAAGVEEQVTLMVEIGQRSRRGLRYHKEKHKMSFAELIAEKIKDEKPASGNDTLVENAKPQAVSKIRLRRDHKRLAYSIPRR